jgi:threonine synthase
MDVGNPSNFERYAQLNPLKAENTDCYMVSDKQIKKCITQHYSRFHQIWCPHTACAAEAWAELGPLTRHKHWILVATAHPYKFREVVEPLIGQTIAPPPAMQDILHRDTRKISIAKHLANLAKNL